MTRRGWAVLGVGLALLAVCGLSVLMVVGTYGALRSAGQRIRFLDFAGVPATARSAATYPVGDRPRLVVDTDAGGITVTVGSAGVIEVETVKTAWGQDAVAARAAAQALAVSARQDGDTVTLSYKAPADVVIVGGRRGTDKVGFNVKVPASTAVALTTGAGDARLAGTRGQADLRSSFGTVTAEDLSGPVAANSSAGAVTVRRVRSDGAVTASSDFGAVTVADVVARALTATTSSGAVTADDVTARTTLTAGSDFGPVTVRRARAGGFDLRSGNGAITVEAPTLTDSAGTLSAHSSFGPVRVTGARDAVLDLASDNGAVHFAGTLAAGRAHRARTSFGAVTVAVPAGSRLTVSLATDFGQVSSDLPLTVSGEMGGQKIEGTLNGGGAPLQLSSSNGDVRLERLAPTTR
jgi:DUF4097 and DUF4098 domain-containing protein YvlB